MTILLNWQLELITFIANRGIIYDVEFEEHNDEELDNEDELDIEDGVDDWEMFFQNFVLICYLFCTSKERISSARKQSNGITTKK